MALSHNCHLLLLIVTYYCGQCCALLNLASPVSCGVSSPNNLSSPRTSRVVGGKVASPGQFPWAVSLRKRNSGRKSRHTCAGSLLTSRHVVTAAHCLHKTSIDQWEAVAGEYQPEAADNQEQNIKISRMTPHPNYHHPFKQYDIAILRLAEAVVWSEFIQPICLPDNVNQDVGAKDAVITGWGNDGPISEGGKPSKMLMYASLPILSNQECKKWYKDLNTPSTIYTGNSIQGSHMCTGVQEGGRDGCRGDSGGGLIATDPSGNSILVGITSAGYRCGLPRVPAIYTRVSEFVTWLQDETGG